MLYCETCGLFPFANEEQKDCHMDKNHAGDTRQHGCNLCDLDFVQQCYRSKHYYTHHIGYHPWNCIKCGHGFINKPTALAHVKECKDAKKARGRRGGNKAEPSVTLAGEESILSDASTTPNNFAVPITFTMPSTFMEIVKEKIKPGNIRVRYAKLYDYQCDECREVFTIFSDVLNHKKIAHPVFSCKWCEETFKIKEDLGLHCVTSHNDELLKFCLNS